MIGLLLTACSEHKPTPGAGELNAQASVPGNFNFSKLGLKVICSTINKKRGAMSTLYGNDSAKATAMAGDGKCLPGSVFALVTWKQQADERWIGANIPGQLLSIEMVKATPGQVFASYSRYKGADLKLDADTSGQNERTKYILGLKPSIMF